MIFSFCMHLRLNRPSSIVIIIPFIPPPPPPPPPGEYNFDDEPDSSINVSGKWIDGKGGLNAVVGGTGKFANIEGGEAKYKKDEDDMDWNIVKITLYDWEL